ncbi:phospholipase effector Tle1 domain-containing protein, partial [Kaistella jeonii]|uniref:phospholipase effector Tle1 domain-containing protein n=1 Tax=Kaistella jeonii TaxID=266749 RepID=UPI00057CFF89
MGTFVYNTGNGKAAVGELHLSFGMFFDGTLNNMKNTELRKKYLEKGNDIKPDDDDETIARKEKKHEAALDEQDEKYHMYKKTKIDKNNEEYLKYLRNSHRDAIDKQGTDNSYANDYTNVARKYTCCERKKYAQYIEGIGTGIGTDDPMQNPTDDIAEDNTHGFMYGAGKTGIRGKVRKGCKNLALKIGEEKNRKDNKNKVLSEITIDVFGFSRGAAAARNFAYEVVVKEQETPRSKTKREKVGYRNSRSLGNDGVIPIYENKTTYKDGDWHAVDASAVKDGKMPVRGLLGYYLISEGVLSLEELEGLSVTNRFLGIYETVCSYEETYDNGVILKINIARSLKNDLFKNDVAQLNLNSLRVTKAVHFTAQDEHRKNFRLTRMKTGIEKNFPGVHCDIGGAYENETEVKTEIETNNHLSNNGLDDYKQPVVHY